MITTAAMSLRSSIAEAHAASSATTENVVSRTVAKNATLPGGNRIGLSPLKYASKTCLRSDSLECFNRGCSVCLYGVGKANDELEWDMP